jgi:hypothetical protein
MIPEWLRPLFRFGTGAGILIGADDLTIHVARLRPAGPKLLGWMTVEDFRRRPATEWGSEYQKLLDRLKTGPVPTVAILPREQALLRTIALPGVADQDAPAAIRFQLDGLYPFQEDEAIVDWGRIGQSSHYAVGIAEKRVIDEYTGLFAEAGIKLSGMTIAASAFFSSMRIYGEPPASGVLAVADSDPGGAGFTEIYGESPSRPLFSASMPAAEGRACSLASAELRLAPQPEVPAVADLLPRWTSAPEDFDFSEAGRRRAAGPWAAALAAAQPRFAPPLNLWPAELRFVTSRLLWIPTAVLGALLLIVLGAWAFMGPWLREGYLDELDRRIALVAPDAGKVEAMDKEVAAVVERIQLLDQYKKRTRADMDLVLEVTRSFPPPAFFSSLAFDRGMVSISGEVPNTDGLLKKLDESPRLSGSEFTMPLGRSGSNEVFRIRARRDGGAF